MLVVFPLRDLLTERNNRTKSVYASRVFEYSCVTLISHG